jgi:hypothetical protein
MGSVPPPIGGESHAHHPRDHDDGGLTDIELRVRALESLMIEKGYVDPAALDAIVETYETRIGPRNGARWWPEAGRTDPSANGSATMRRRRFNRWDIRGGRASI